MTVCYGSPSRLVCHVWWFLRVRSSRATQWVVLVQVWAAAVVSSEGLAGAGTPTSMVAYARCWDVGDGCQLGALVPFPLGLRKPLWFSPNQSSWTLFFQFRYMQTIHTNYIIRRNMTALIFNCQNFGVINSKNRDFPGDAMDRNSPARAGDMGLIPGLGRFHMPCNSWACGPQLVSPRSATGETTAVRSPHHNEEQPLLAATGRRPVPSTENPVPP